MKWNRILLQTNAVFLIFKSKPKIAPNLAPSFQNYSDLLVVFYFNMNDNIASCDPLFS